MPQTIIDLLKQGTRANNADRFRRSNLICLPAKGSLVVAGDIHGHRRNFERLIAFADLINNPDRHIVLQEIIHGGPQDSEGTPSADLSYELLFDVVRYKLTFPDRIHTIMGNHDIAFINSTRVMKDGKEMNRSMRLALDRQFQQNSADVQLAMKQFLFSQPLAVRCENRIWMSHSLPGDRFVAKFDRQIFDRELKISDCIKPGSAPLETQRKKSLTGSAYLLVWGRKHSQATLDRMAELLNVDTFILGHQPQPQGWSRAGRNLIIIASDHNHGCLLSIDLAGSYTAETIIDSIVPLASIT